MSRNWTPQTHVSVSDAGMLVAVQLDGTLPGSVDASFEAGQLYIRGQHEDFGSFEARVEIPPGYSPAQMQTIMAKSVLHVYVPPSKGAAFLSEFPRSMLIYCNACGKHFDIVVAGKGPGKYPCPACGKVQIFDLDAYLKQAMEQCGNLGKKRGRQ